MVQPTCEVCGQPAVVHETEINASSVKTRHLCQAHGEAGWRDAVLSLGDADFQASALRDLEDQWRRLSENDKQQLAQLHRLSRRCR
jgi:hypothetical protein